MPPGDGNRWAKECQQEQEASLVRDDWNAKRDRQASRQLWRHNMQAQSGCPGQEKNRPFHHHQIVDHVERLHALVVCAEGRLLAVMRALNGGDESKEHDTHGKQRRKELGMQMPHAAERFRDLCDRYGLADTFWIMRGQY